MSNHTHSQGPCPHDCPDYAEFEATYGPSGYATTEDLHRSFGYFHDSPVAAAIRAGETLAWDELDYRDMCD